MRWWECCSLHECGRGKVGAQHGGKRRAQVSGLLAQASVGLVPIANALHDTVILLTQAVTRLA